MMTHLTYSRTLNVASSVGLLGAALLSLLGCNAIIIDRESPIATCADRVLRPEVEQLLKPVLLASQRDDWGPQFYALEQLLASRRPAALEARVALMAYYIGEHPGEELLESVLGERELATPLVREYRECRPRLQSETQIGRLRVLQTLYRLYETELAKKAG